MMLAVHVHVPQSFLTIFPFHGNLTVAMPEKITAENFLNNLVETITDNVPRQKSGSFFEETATSRVNKLFGRQKPVHHLLGGGKSADVLLWRNKKISASVLTSATVVWVLFEWLNYNFLTLVCFALILRMLVQFVWINASRLMNRSPSTVPPLVLPHEVFTNVGIMVGDEVNRTLGILHDIATGGNLKHFLVALGSLLAAAIIGSWFNFLTVIYIGFVAAHTLPVVYEKYDEQIDNFVYKVFEQLQHNYKKLDAGVLSKIPKGNLKKHE